MIRSHIILGSIIYTYVYYIYISSISSHIISLWNFPSDIHINVCVKQSDKPTIVCWFIPGQIWVDPVVATGPKLGSKASRRASQEEKALEAALGPLQAPADPQKNWGYDFQK